MGKIIKVEQLTNNPFLNLFDVTKKDKKGKIGHYFVASRNKTKESLKLHTKENNPDAVIIVPLYGKSNDKLVLIKQYRYAIDDYIYELPAGIIDNGETYNEAAIRELKEETGLLLTPIQVDSFCQRPYFSSVGMTDESCVTVFGYATGKIDLSNTEDDEDIEVVIVNREDAKRILETENVSVRCAYMLMSFINNAMK